MQVSIGQKMDSDAVELRTVRMELKRIQEVVEPSSELVLYNNLNITAIRKEDIEDLFKRPPKTIAHERDIGRILVGDLPKYAAIPVREVKQLRMLDMALRESKYRDQMVSAHVKLLPPTSQSHLIIQHQNDIMSFT
jgi:hypothetical protein